MLEPLPRSAPNLDLDPFRPGETSLLGHPIEEILPELTHLGSPSRMVYDHDQRPTIKSERKHVGGDGGTDHLCPAGEQSGCSLCIPYPEAAGDSIE
jgi:hypothetical protein